MSDDFVFKVLLLGDSTVGKTCFLMKYTDEMFSETYMSTIGLDYRLKSMELKNGKKIKLQIWDTAGQDRFRAITRNYYKSAHGIILIYDITNKVTFDNVKTWIAQIRERAPKKVIIFLVGNKIDMETERKIQTEEGQKLADELGFPFYETSAMNGININKTFEDLVNEIDITYEKLDGNSSSDSKKNKIYIGGKKKKKRWC